MIEFRRVPSKLEHRRMVDVAAVSPCALGLRWQAFDFTVVIEPANGQASFTSPL
jgi:hypothetical protein